MEKAHKIFKEDLLARIEYLEKRLAEAEGVLHSIHSGEVDALVVETDKGPQIFSLKGADEPYRIMVETMNEGAVTLLPNGTIIYCNKRFADIIKTPLENIIGNPIYLFIQSGEEIFFDEYIHRESKKDRKEISLQSADGEIVPVLISMSPIDEGIAGSMCLLITDITELQAAQQSLQKSLNELERRVEERTYELLKSETRYRILVEMLPDCIIVHQNGSIVFINSSGVKLLGLSSPEDAIGRSIFDIIPPDMQDIARERIRKIEEQGIPAPVLEYTMRRFNGKPFSCEESGNMIIINDKASTQIIIRDISKRKVIDEKLALFALELERSNKELDDFAYIASHDLKEPLRGIYNYSAFLLEDYADKIDDKGKDKLNTLVYLTKRLEGFISDLLKYSKVGRISFSMKEIDMNDVVKDSLSIMKHSLEKDQINVRISRPLPAVMCDHNHIGEVFQNLFSNAIKYNDKLDKWIEIGYLDEKSIESGKYKKEKNIDNKDLIFYVRDNGIGIDKKYFDSIFTIFKRLHGREKFGGGTGAGLSIVKKIIERHGGKIWIESESGVGTTFYFSLGRGDYGG